jgi:hypothetical protein
MNYWRENFLPKEIEDILIDMRFIDKYKDLYENYPYTGESYQWKAAEIILILNNLGIEAKKHNKEQIFTDFIENQGFLFRFGISIKYNTIHFDISIRNEKLGLKAGGGFGLLVQIMTDWKIPINSASFNSHRELESLLTDAVKLYEDIKQNIIDYYRFRAE